MDGKLVVLDYDFIYSSNIELWDNIAMLLKESGAIVYLVSQRGKEYKENFKLNEAVFAGILFTGFQEKKPYVRQYFNKEADVWIDSSLEPVFIKH